MFELGSSVNFFDDSKSSLEVIDNESFSNYLLLSEIIIPSTVKRIGNNAFYKNGLNNAVFMNSENQESQLEEISNSAFEQCISLHSIKIPFRVKRIGDKAFSECKIESIEFQTNSLLETIGEDAFFLSQIESISLSDHLQKC